MSDGTAAVNLDGQPWTEYYANRATRPEPRPLLLKALRELSQEGVGPGRAVDLGCGEGSDTAELLRQGWTVHAVDASQEGVDRARAQAEVDGTAQRLTTQCSRFEDLGELPPADLYYAALSLPFAGPEAFDQVWQMVRGAVEANGAWVAFHLFGVEDDWNVKDGHALAFHDIDAAQLLLVGLEVRVLDELRWDGPAMDGRVKHWHGFEIIAHA